MQKIIDQLFLELNGYFPDRAPFTQGANVLAVTKRVWSEQIQRKEIKPEDLRRGLNRIVDDGLKFFPNIAEFLELCKPRPEDLGIPKPEEAYQEACTFAYRDRLPNWSHQVVYHAAKLVGLHRLASQRQESTRPEFFRHYEQACKDYIDGKPLEALPEPQRPKNKPKPKWETDPVLAARLKDIKTKGNHIEIMPDDSPEVREQKINAIIEKCKRLTGITIPRPSSTRT